MCYKIKLTSGMNNIEIESCQSIRNDVNSVVLLDSNQRVTKTTVPRYMKRGLVEMETVKK